MQARLSAWQIGADKFLSDSGIDFRRRRKPGTIQSKTARFIAARKARIMAMIMSLVNHPGQTSAIWLSRKPDCRAIMAKLASMPTMPA